MGQLFAYTRLCCCCSLTLLDACLAYQQETQGLVSLLCHCFHSSSCACGWHKKISWEDGKGQLPIQTKRKRKKNKKKFKNIAEGNTIKRSPLREPLLTGVNTSPLVLLSLKRIAEPYSELCELYR
jgi:hypothetical protein